MAGDPEDPDDPEDPEVDLTGEVGDPVSGDGERTAGDGWSETDCTARA